MPSETFTVRLPHNDLAKLKEIAKVDHRTVGNLVRKILAEWLVKNA